MYDLGNVYIYAGEVGILLQRWGEIDDFKIKIVSLDIYMLVLRWPIMSIVIKGTRIII